MWVQGYKIQKNILPPYHVQQIVRRLVHDMADKYDIPFNSSVHSEACYLYVSGKIVSFRNHPGRNYDIVINLSDFRTWGDCKKYFVEKVLPGLGVNNIEIGN